MAYHINDNVRVYKTLLDEWVFVIEKNDKIIDELEIKKFNNEKIARLTAVDIAKKIALKAELKDDIKNIADYFSQKGSVTDEEVDLYTNKLIKELLYNKNIQRAINY